MDRPLNPWIDSEVIVHLLRGGCVCKRNFQQYTTARKKKLKEEQFREENKLRLECNRAPAKEEGMMLRREVHSPATRSLECHTKELVLYSICNEKPLEG
jgi:hypothetical protein